MIQFVRFLFFLAYLIEGSEKPAYVSSLGRAIAAYTYEVGMSMKVKTKI